MSTIQRTATGECLAAYADAVNASVREVIRDESTIILCSPRGEWKIAIASLTSNAASVMPCGSDGMTRSSQSKPRRECGYFASNFDLDNHPHKAQKAAMTVIGRSKLIHRHEAHSKRDAMDDQHDAATDAAMCGSDI